MLISNPLCEQAMDVSQMTQSTMLNHSKENS